MNDGQGRQRSRAMWRSAGIAAVAIALTLAAVAALRQPSLPDYRPSGPPQALPVDGSLQPADIGSFGGILVGQRGTPVVVNVWASWCAPCRTEMPLLQRAAKTYQGRAVVLGVASKDDPVAAEAFLSDYGLTYPNVFDARGDIRVALGLTAFPTTYVFGADGKLLTTVTGGISEQRLAALIDAALR